MPIALRAPGVEWTLREDGVHMTATADIDLRNGPILLELRCGTRDLSDDYYPETVRRQRAKDAWSTWAERLRLPTIETEAGSATIAQQYGLLGLCYCVPSATGLQPFVAFAAGALRTSFDARAEPPHVAHQITRWSLLLDRSVGARLRLSRRYYLTLAGHMQLAEPYVSVYFVSTRVATTERPNLLVSLTVGAWL